MPQSGVSVGRGTAGRELYRLDDSPLSTSARLRAVADLGEIDGRGRVDDRGAVGGRRAVDGRGSATPRPIRATPARAVEARARRTAEGGRPGDRTGPPGMLPPRIPEGGVPGRRTITITGQGAERHASSTYARRRAHGRRHERPGFQPDRAAMWAVLLGLLLVLIAATSSHATTRSSRVLTPHAPAALVARPR